jgi:hypothetical protein
MGEQAYSDRLMPRIREYEMAGHWKFLGNLDPIQMAAFYPNLDVFTVPSLKFHRSLWARADRSDDERRAQRSIRAAGGASTSEDARHGTRLELANSESLSKCSFLKCWTIKKNIAVDIPAIKTAYDPDSIAQEYEKLFAKLMEKS